jgi:hypothetical protein
VVEEFSRCRSGGIGRHAILRGWWATARASSILAFGTKKVVVIQTVFAFRAKVVFLCTIKRDLSDLLSIFFRLSSEVLSKLSLPFSVSGFSRHFPTVVSHLKALPQLNQNFCKRLVHDIFLSHAKRTKYFRIRLYACGIVILHSHLELS